MYSTYSAILRDQTLEWTVEKPRNLTHNRAVHVHVTILDETPTATASDQGRRMAAALEKLAHSASRHIPADPVAWERETREDRPLPGREA